MVFLSDTRLICHSGSEDRRTISSQRQNDEREKQRKGSPESGRQVDRHVLVPLFEALVLGHIVQVVASDHNRPLHFHLLDNPFQDPSPDPHVPGERALLVDVRSIRRLAEQR